MNKLMTIIALALIFPVTITYAEDDGHGHSKPHVELEKPGHDDHDKHEDGDKHEDEEGVVKLDATQMKTAGIKIIRLEPQIVASTIKAPSEVKLNAYRTIKVTPRIASQIIKRHARLGDAVKPGQALITLSSVEMASAQGELLVADREWQRVKKLGKKVVSGRRYSEASIAYSQAVSKVKAYGMSKVAIKKLLQNQSTHADGTFQLLSTIDGRVLHDDFIVGERVDAGKELMVVSDESVMWVEARITPLQAGLINIGNSAQIKINKMTLPAKVSQIHHALDETTRTLAVRIEVNNPGDTLHPGMFVSADIQTNSSTNALSLPEAAVLRAPDGDWQVFVEQDEQGEFKAVEIELLRVDKGRAIIEGIKAGSRVVSHGAFFVRSELAKGGFDIHNH